MPEAPSEDKLLARFRLLHKRYGVSASVIRAFQKLILFHFRSQGRDFPWRRTRDPYRILVSEFMLQQTQTSRVKSKYREFIRAFPTVRKLAAAPRAAVLAQWQGLGYNRRAVALHETARAIVANHRGRVPGERESLMSLPGVGQSTAGAVRAFAFGKPEVLVETNIRRVFLHLFFSDRQGVRDAELHPFIERTMDHENPRSWYYALMDYGVHLAGNVPNPNRRSVHYAKQSRFEGSHRQLRGQVLRWVLQEGPVRLDALAGSLGRDADRVAAVVR
jgi:A/G-specific adenine glycosylase